MYEKTPRGVFFNGELCEAIDPASFEIIVPRYLGRDKQGLWVRGGLQTGIRDPQTYAVIDSQRGLGDELFARDAQAVYCQYKVIKDADPTTFRVYDIDFVGDARHVWHVGLYNKLAPLAGVRASSWRRLGEGLFSTDGAGVWHGAEPLDADAASFTLLRAAFAKDAARVFWAGQVLDGADPAGFRVLDDVYATDGRRVYAIEKSKVKEIKSADAASFELWPGRSGQARDKNYVYSYGKRLKS